MKHQLSVKVIFFFVFLGLVSFTGEPELVERLQKKLRDAYAAGHAGILYVVFNQPAYAPGDTAFFKIHWISARDRTPMSAKEFVNVELLNAKKEIVLSSRVLVEGGHAASLLVFPGDVGAGVYTLVAYGHQMEERTPPALFVQEPLTIVGEKVFEQVEKTGVEVHAEGGNFVAGIPNHIVVEAVYQGSEGYVYDSKDERILTFPFDRGGSGSFDIVPTAGESYFVEYGGLKVPVPPFKPQGITMQVAAGAKEGVFNARIHVSPGYKAWEALYLVVNAQDKICFSSQVMLKGSAADITIPLGRCGNGLVQLTLLDDKAEIMAERLLFKAPDPVEITISLDKDQYSVRSPVEADILFEETSGKIIEANASVSVYNSDLFPSAPRSCKGPYRLLAKSDLGGLIGAGCPNGLDSIDSDYLVSKRSARVVWNEVIKKSYPPVAKQASVAYFRGKALQHEGGPVPDSSLITFYLHNSDITYGVYTADQGAFEFPLFMKFDDERILYTIEYEGKGLQAHIILEETSGNITAGAIGVLNVRPGNEPDPYQAFARLRLPVLQSYNHYRNMKDPMGLSEENDTNDPVADFTTDLTKYKPFATVSELLQEVVPVVKCRRTETSDAVRVFLKEGAAFARAAPLYFIDGILTDSTAYFLSLDPASFIRISVLRSRSKLSRFGALGANGIIAVRTTGKTINQVPVTRRTLLMPGVSKPALFKSPDYSRATQARIPDLRSTLYWNPEIVQAKDGGASLRFFTGDGPGTYVLKVEGITKDGRPFVKEKEFKVSRND